MQEGRRTFLGKMAAGLAALAGLLWPKSAEACHRRQACFVPQYQPLPPCPYPFPMQTVDRDPVTISFPVAGADVPGGGGLFAWGRHMSDVTIKMVTCGPNAPIPVAPPIGGTGGTNCTWAYRINGLTVGASATLVITYNSISMPVMPDPVITRTFTPRA